MKNERSANGTDKFNSANKNQDTSFMTSFMCLGMSIGMLIGGLLFHNMILGMSAGMCIGIAIGAGLDDERIKKAMQQGRSDVINVEGYTKEQNQSL